LSETLYGEVECFCHGIAKGGDCKVHYLYWLDSIAKHSMYVLVVA